MMFEEAWTMPVPDLITELMDMGVEETLIQHAEVDPRLVAGLYLYVHVEAMNCDSEIVEVQELLQGDPWRQGTQSCRKCQYREEGKWDGWYSTSHTCEQDDQPDTDDGLVCEDCGAEHGAHYPSCMYWGT